MWSAGPESAKGRTLKAYNARRLAIYGPSSGHTCKAQGLRAESWVPLLLPFLGAIAGRHWDASCGMTSGAFHYVSGKKKIAEARIEPGAFSLTLSQLSYRGSANVLATKLILEHSATHLRKPCRQRALQHQHSCQSRRSASCEGGPRVLHSPVRKRPLTTTPLQNGTLSHCHRPLGHTLAA